eukprot:TCONS_00028612-protein
MWGKLRITISLLMIVNLPSTHASINNQSLPVLNHRIYYYPLKPYLYKDENTGQTKGLLLEIIEMAMVYCIERAQGIKMKFHWYQRFNNHSHYINLLQSNFFDNETRVTNFPEYSSSDYLWLGPFLSIEVDVFNPTYTWVNRAFQLALSPGAYVILDRRHVSWKWKMWDGIKNCQNYLVLAVMLCICMGTLVYLIESRHDDNEFGKSISDGVWNGLWWSFVTMSTVGYGDIVPHSRTGRIISLLWLLFGVVMGSIITATVTNAMTSDANLHIKGKKVAVLRHSWEKQIASAHGGITTELDSYDEVIQSVRNGDVFGAVINSDIVQWRQNEIRSGDVPLTVGYYIEMTIPVRMNVILYGNITDVWKCLTQFRSEIIETPQRKYFRYVEIDKIQYVSLREMLYDDPFGFSFVVATSLIIIFCAVWYLLERCYFNQKMSIHAAWRYFREQDNKGKSTDSQKPSIQIPRERRHTRVSFGGPYGNVPTIHGNFNPMINDVSGGGGGFLNPSFTGDKRTDDFEMREKLNKIEDDVNEIKKAIRKISMVDNKRKKTIDYSNLLAA